MPSRRGPQTFAPAGERDGLLMVPGAGQWPRYLRQGLRLPAWFARGPARDHYPSARDNLGTLAWA